MRLLVPILLSFLLKAHAESLPLTPTDSLIFDHTFNLRFNQALAIARDGQKRLPDDPKYFFMEAAIHFSQRAFVSNTGPYKTRRARRDSLMRVILNTTRPAIRRFEGRPLNDSQKMFMAGLYGYQGRVYAEEEKWWDTFTNGLKGRRILNELHDKDPENYDVLLGLGIFNYYSDRLSGVIGFVAKALGFSGNREEGIHMLKECFTHAPLTRSEAAVTLIDIYDSYENNERGARPYFEWMLKRYPQNRLILDWYLNRMINIARFDLIHPFFADSSVHIAPETRGRYYFELCRYDAARDAYQQALRHPERLTPVQTAWIHYHLQIMDLLEGKPTTEYAELLPWMRNDLKHFRETREDFKTFTAFKCRMAHGVFADIVHTYSAQPPIPDQDPFYKGWFAFVMSTWHCNAQNWDNAERFAWEGIRTLPQVFGGGCAKNLIYIYTKKKPSESRYKRLKTFIKERGFEKLLYQFRDIPHPNRR
ncbi:MAG: hypothetical protein D6677_04835 [Calditrichaeota bacterium]|nr:MAG: hypothetical protein D6677_04835 [Calditrichota bacterium]